MFAKPYKLKSNTTLKNSEKKQLIQRIMDYFPHATEEKSKELMPVKSSIICMKLVLHSGDTVSVYVVDNVPMAIEASERLYPTVFALWKVPDLVPSIIVHSAVLPKMQNGAPLYLPGVHIPEGGVGFPQFARGAPLALQTDSNAAAAVVGHATMSSADMIFRVGGVCMETVHIVGDLLCKDNKFTKRERPHLGPPSTATVTSNITTDISQLNISQHPAIEEWPSLVPALTPVPESVLPPAEVPVEVDKDILDDPQTEDNIPTDMDALLRFCLLSFIKLEAKTIELPLKTNLLYRNHLIPLCPRGRTLDVKKSTYKKMGKFLEAMEREGLIQVKEIERGVDAIVTVVGSHDLVRAHTVPREQVEVRSAPAPGERVEREYTPPTVQEMYCVTADVLFLFAPLKKGAALPPREVRATLTRWVRERELQRGELLELDTQLARIAGRPTQELIKWDELMSAVQNRMTPCTEMRFADGSVTHNKNKLEPIKMQVATRSGNKKVTLVSNLEGFGFNLLELSKVCQHGVAASCGVTRTPGAKRDQLMVQGDQTHFMAKLLIEKYGLPKKFVEGADKALKKRNK